MKILLTGASGFIGQALTARLLLDQHELTYVTRDRQSFQDTFPFPGDILEWDELSNPESLHRLQQIDAIIHLAGAPLVGRRWNTTYKKVIYDSRIETTKQLLGLIEKLDRNQARTMICASAIGIYQQNGDQWLDEQSPKNDDFVGQVCRDWEATTSQASALGCRTIQLRFGLVLGQGGGLLQKLEPLFQFGLGSALGDGNQWMSWIHVDDLVELIGWSLATARVEGPLNVVAPEPVRNCDFTRQLAARLGRSSFVPVPGWALRMVEGQASEVILANHRVKSQSVEKMGFRFRFRNLGDALENLLGRDQPSWRFSSDQWLPIQPNVVFEFFSQPKNLEAVMPKDWHVKVESDATQKMQMGSRFSIRLRRFGLPLRWQVEVVDWNPTDQFADRQIQGPFRRWQHSHRFTPLKGGTWIQDTVDFWLPLGRLGNALGYYWTQKDLKRTFETRRHEIRAKLCPDYESPKPSNL